MESLIIYCNRCSSCFRFMTVDDLSEARKHHKGHLGEYEE